MVVLCVNDGLHMFRTHEKHDCGLKFQEKKLCLVILPKIQKLGEKEKNYFKCFLFWIFIDLSWLWYTNNDLRVWKYKRMLDDFILENPKPRSNFQEMF